MMTTKTYEAKRRDGSKIRVTVPAADSGREMEAAVDALRAIADWASDTGALKGADPMTVSEYTRATLKAIGEE